MIEQGLAEHRSGIHEQKTMAEIQLHPLADSPG